MILMGSGAMTERGLRAAGRIAQTGVRVFMDTFVSRQPRGAGRFAPERLPYWGEKALASLQGIDLMILAGTKTPVAFFAYPGMPSVLVPEGCAVETLCRPDEDCEWSLLALADTVAAAAQPNALPWAIPEDTPRGDLTPVSIGISIARHLPEDAVVSEDAVTAGLDVYALTSAVRSHDWLFLTGGAIGQGIPAAIGAAIAQPQRKILCLTGDGAAAYTLQALWTLARERLNVAVIVFANRAYRILDWELTRTQSGSGGSRARSLLDLTDPMLDWRSIAEGCGLNATRCDTAESFDAALANALAENGPSLIEAVI